MRQQNLKKSVHHKHFHRNRLVARRIWIGPLTIELYVPSSFRIGYEVDAVENKRIFSLCLGLFGLWLTLRRTSHESWPDASREWSISYFGDYLFVHLGSDPDLGPGAGRGKQWALPVLDAVLGQIRISRAKTHEYERTIDLQDGRYHLDIEEFLTVESRRRIRKPEIYTRYVIHAVPGIKIESKRNTSILVMDEYATVADDVDGAVRVFQKAVEIERKRQGYEEDAS